MESLPHRYQLRAPPLCLANGTLHSLSPAPVGPAPHCPDLRPRPFRALQLRLRPSSANGPHKLGTRRPHPASVLIGQRQCRGREAERREAEQDGRHLARSRSRNPRLRPGVHTSPRPSATTAQSEPSLVACSYPALSQVLSRPGPPTLSQARSGLPAGSRGRPGDDERRINGAQGRQRCLPAALPARAHRHRAAATRCAVLGGGACGAGVAQNLLPPGWAASSGAAASPRWTSTAGKP